MKLKSSLFIVAATAGLAASASAVTTTVVDIVGSTAGRSAVITNVKSLIGGAAVTEAFDSTSDTASTAIIMKGTYASAPIIVRFNFTGSAAGVQQVSQQISTVSFYKTTTTTTTAGVASLTFASPNIETSAPEIGYSDVFQSTTAYTSPALTEEVGVAIIPFKFFKNRGASASLTNITSQMVHELYGVTGDAPLSMFTGNAANTDSVYAIGRDASSGTRITAFAETGTSQTAVSQYQPTVVGTAVTALGSPSSTGFSKGSLVKGVVNATYSGGLIVGYLGASDWFTESASTGTSLSFNGVPYSTDALYNGQYTFWGYLHMFNQGLSGTSAAFSSALKDAIIAAPGSGLEPIGSMNCTRAGDGFVVVPSGGA